MDVYDNCKAVIAKNMTENGHDGGFVIHGYTKCKLRHNNYQIIYHANPSLLGSEWYDFCMVDFDDNMCPACIHGYFQYKSSGIPTNVLLGDGKSMEDVGAHDYSMHAVV